jgi:carboxyl-terminal processing protease
LVGLLVLAAGGSAQEAAPQAPPQAPPQEPSSATLQNTEEVAQYLALFAEVLARIRQHHADNPQAKQIVEGAIRGMLQTLDPYSQYYGPEAYRDFQTETSGRFGGVGMYIGVKQNRLTVIAPIQDTPAARAGVLAGDFIAEIDGASTAGVSADDAASKMRGEPGTNVTLTILREGLGEPLVVTITRDIITIRSVRSGLLRDQVGYIRITQFIEPTAAAVGEAVETLQSQGARGLVLDLRNNPGGLLTSAVAVASLFLNDGDLIVYTKGREEREEHRATAPERRSDLPVVVLVDQGSASASEILAGALRAHRRALVIGGPTFGKASVQKVFPLREGADGAAVKLTVAHYFTPDDVDIHNVGIVPDIELPATNAVEARMYRSVRTSAALGDFLDGEPDDVLDRLTPLRPGESPTPLHRKYQTFLDALQREGIVLSDALIRLAIAAETLRPEDDYQNDPQVQAAAQYLQAYRVFGRLKSAPPAPSESSAPSP